ncbi:MAG: histidine kinase [Trichocoleus desertorum ATA4-8-CV12]|jgi:two-component system clock-associated histidine kinase SasA|nr:histidine kinase [Trichocoleus desertorum ATA4-8-CV12]
MKASPDKPINPETPLQLLLFVDKRPNSGEQIRHIRSYLKNLKAQYSFDLQVVDVGEQPYLAEHFKLVATPALIKIHPEPRQTLAGSTLVTQLENWWPRWQRSVEEYLSTLEPQVETSNPDRPNATINSVAYSAELMRLTDEIFRLQQDQEELQEQLRFKDRIIAMLAHDLRNPLTAASIAIETLELSYSPKEGLNTRLKPGVTAQLLKHAKTQTRAIDRMITDILQAARGTSGGFQIQPQKLELGALCQEVLAYLRDRFQTKDQQMTHDIPSDLPLVYADPERVRQVLINLLDNAIKYAPAQGTIAISVLHRTTQKVQVSICDNGPGVPEENQERIFEEHFRLKRDEAQEGYGIGLALCQRIVRAHYGQIWVDSVPNQGSSFHFTLPVYRP